RDPRHVRPNLASAFRLAPHVLRLRYRQPGQHGNSREDIRPHLGPGRAASARGRPTATTLRFPTSLRLRQHPPMDERRRRCPRDAALSVSLHGSRNLSQHVLLRAHLARFHGHLCRHHPATPEPATAGGILMRRDPHTGAPDFFQCASDYLHAYMPKTRGLSPKTIEAYRISLECFLDYLTEAEDIGREHVSFDHFERQHLKGWLTWMTDQRRYTPKTVTLRLSAVKAFLTYAAYEDLTLVALSQSAKALKAPTGPRRPIEYLTETQTRAILAAFTGQTAKSRRNRMLLILLYDTAARVGEITGLTLQDLCLTEP